MTFLYTWPTSSLSSLTYKLARCERSLSTIVSSSFDIVAPERSAMSCPPSDSVSDNSAPSRSIAQKQKQGSAKGKNLLYR